MRMWERMRIDWIYARVAKVGHVRRGDLMETFGISMPTASKDLATFQRERPEALAYNKSTKRYEVRNAGQDAAPVVQ